MYYLGGSRQISVLQLFPRVAVWVSKNEGQPVARDERGVTLIHTYFETYICSSLQVPPLHMLSHEEHCNRQPHLLEEP